MPIQIPSWNSTQFAEIAEALDNLQGFDNILELLAGADAFFYGSEDGEALNILLVYYILLQHVPRSILWTSQINLAISTQSKVLTLDSSNRAHKHRTVHKGSHQ